MACGPAGPPPRSPGSESPRLDWRPIHPGLERRTEGGAVRTLGREDEVAAEMCRWSLTPRQRTAPELGTIRCCPRRRLAEQATRLSAAPSIHEMGSHVTRF